MRRMERLHPICTLLYLLLVLGVTVFSREPVVLAESLSGAILTAVALNKAKALWSVPTVIIAVAVTNPLFVHNGMTVLFFVEDIPFTLEAVVYGAIFGVCISAAALWSVCSVSFMTTDKYIMLFGSVVPSLGLVLSCAVRFLPLFIRRTAEYMVGKESLRDKLKAVSMSMGHSAEQAMEQALSMRSRGYGTVKRTFYSTYRFTLWDRTVLVCILLFGAGSIVGMALGGGQFYYYPALSRLRFLPADMLLYVCFGALCIIPFATALWENGRAYQYSESGGKERKC